MTEGGPVAVARVRRRTRRSAAALSAAVLLVGLAACSGDGSAGGSGALDPASPTTAATSTPSATPTSTTPSATPSPTAAPLSRFEADPGVRAMRVFLRQSALALNANTPRLPALLASSTRAQQADFPRLKAANPGYVPGPTPTTPLSVRNLSTTRKVITACVLDSGWNLTRKGGTAINPRKVGGVEVTTILQGGSWKVDSIFNSDEVVCTGVRLVEQRF